MSDTCEDVNGGYRCGSCIFSKESSLGCANPNIHRAIPLDSYYKQRGSVISQIEQDSINEHL